MHLVEKLLFSSLFPYIVILMHHTLMENFQNNGVPQPVRKEFLATVKAQKLVQKEFPAPPKAQKLVQTEFLVPPKAQELVQTEFPAPPKAQLPVQTEFLAPPKAQLPVQKEFPVTPTRQYPSKRNFSFICHANHYFMFLEENMKKILVRIRITDADTLSDALVRLYKDTAAQDETIAKDANLATLLGEIEVLSAKLTTAIKADKISVSLEEVDAKRDELIRQIGTLLAGYAVIPVAGKQEAAKALSAVYDKYGKAIVNEPYARESSLIESMLEDFAAPALEESVKALDGVGDLIAALRVAQDDFNKTNDSATAALTAKGESAFALKKPLIASINEKLVPYITAMSTFNSAYADFASKADIEIGKANASAAKKKAASAKSE